MGIRPDMTVLGEIIALDDPVARNLSISRCYRNLALAVADVIGRRDVNWMAFGAWASGSAGSAIRGEIPFDWGTSRAVADGNLAIISDVAPRFLRWFEEIDQAGHPCQEALMRAISDPIFDDAPLLARALVAYQAAYEVMRDHDLSIDVGADKAFAELVLLGNVRVAAHEQEFADHYVDAALPLSGPFGFLTTQFVQVITPDGALRVSRDVPRPSYLGGCQFPPVLESIENAELLALATAYDQLDGVRKSNALSWESLHERMGYIFTFFRVFQRDVRYFEVPEHFTGMIADESSNGAVLTEP